MASATEAVKVQIELSEEATAKLASAVAPIVIRRLVDQWSPFGMPGNTLPAIGTLWIGQGGIYAGNVRGDEGKSDYALIVANVACNAGKWDAAIAWAKGVTADGHSDFTLPQRKEQAILFGNVPELFEKEWYWSGEQYASDPGYAWYQGFTNGNQSTSPKNYELRARAVRRLTI
jgi:hypothetical protein